MTYAFGNILIFHPAAIGDALLATPVAKTLKLNFPGAKITYWSHPSLRQLIFGLSPSVDDFLDYSRESSFFDLAKIFGRLNPDLYVDLSNSTRGRLLPLFTSAMVLRYVKQRPDDQPVMHAVDNFMECIEPVCSEIPKPLFPTIFPHALGEEILPKLLAEHKNEPKPMIGIVPGVGKFRPHRAWLQDGWQYLLKAIIQKDTHIPVLIGGEEEMALCRKLKDEAGEKCLNLAGKLALTETAAVLKRCQIVVSGDTGPAHLAVAVGTPVVGLYGPTSPLRSGPYGYANLVLDQNSSCQCLQNKFCQFTGTTAPGECMERIMLSEIIEKISEIIPDFQDVGENEVTPEFIEGSYMRPNLGS